MSLTFFFSRNMMHISFYPMLNTCRTFNKLRPLGIFPAAAEQNDIKSLKTDCVILFLLISPVLIEWASQDCVSFRTMCCRKWQRQASIRYSEFGSSLTDNWWNKILCQAGNELKTESCATETSVLISHADCRMSGKSGGLKVIHNPCTVRNYMNL